MRLILHNAGHMAAAISVGDTAPYSFHLDYNTDWLRSKAGHPLSPSLAPEFLEGLPADTHSVYVRRFLENWLPEGRALDVAARTFGLSKSSLSGLLVALGRELSSSFSITTDTAPHTARHSRENRSTPTLRHISHGELSRRIAARQHEPFSVWDRKIRLSIAGYQDKLGVYEQDGRWFLVDDPSLASTHILKPDPQARALAGMASNEFFCMRLARAVGLSCASVDLYHVPEPILSVERFDRKVVTTEATTRVARLACIDGCQALNLGVESKYERPFGNNPDVGMIRDGASLAAFFELLSGKWMANPVQAKLAFLRWSIFQLLIGNTDAHAKNITFFCQKSDLRQAPLYDLVCGLAFLDDYIEDNLAMAIGDTFNPRQVRAYDWAHMAFQANIPRAQVGRELLALARACESKLDATRKQVIAEGADAGMVDRICAIVAGQCRQALTDAPIIKDVDASLFKDDNRIQPR